MKHIVVFFSDPNPLDYPLDNADYFQAYAELDAAISNLGAQFSIVRGVESYLGKGSFKNSWQIRDGSVVATGAVIADVIYDKGTHETLTTDETVPVLNVSTINEMCTDKWKTYQLFAQYCPKTLLVRERSVLEAALQAIVGDTIVAKPFDGSEGRGVFVGSRTEFVQQQETFTYPLLVQEFIDSRCGIPGLVAGMHDFRVVVLDGEVLFSYLRTPPSGSMKANVALGGLLKRVPVQDIPEQFLAVVAGVESKMKEFPSRLYSIDMAMTATGPKIIEMNSRVGMSTLVEVPVFIPRLSEKLISMAG